MTKFLGFDIATPLEIEVETDETFADALSGRRHVQNSGLHRIRLTFNLMDSFGGFKVASTLQAHRAKQGIGIAFKTEMPQRLGWEKPATVVSCVTGSAYLRGQTSIRITAANTTEIEAGGFFNMPGADDKIYEVVEGRRGPGNIVIKPGLLVPYTGNAALAFDAPMLNCLYDIDRLSRWTGGVINSSRIQLIEAL